MYDPNDRVEVKSIFPELDLYRDWTEVSRFLAYGLVGVLIREI